MLEIHRKKINVFAKSKYCQAQRHKQATYWSDWFQYIKNQISLRTKKAVLDGHVIRLVRKKETLSLDSNLLAKISG